MTELVLIRVVAYADDLTTGICSTRTGSRNDKRRQKAKKSIIQQLGNFDGAYERMKRLAKETGNKPMTRKDAFKMWLTTQKAREEQITKTLKHFSSQSSPIFSFTCLRFCELLEQRNKNLDFQPNTNEDFNPLYSHHTRCEACGNWFTMHRDGDRDLEHVEPEAKEGYCSYEDFKRGIDAFFDVIKPKKENVEARLDSMRDVDPNLVRSALRDED